MYRPLSDSVSMSEMLHMREERGLSNKEIAAKLGIGASTVYRYIGNQPEGLRKPYRRKVEPELPPVEETCEPEPTMSFTERLVAMRSEEANTDVTEAQEHDVINHPKHYTREGAMESIDEMLLIFGVEAVKHFCVCNAWKYRYRAALKNGEEDIKKSDWYLRKYKELSEKVGS